MEWEHDKQYLFRLTSTFGWDEAISLCNSLIEGIEAASKSQASKSDFATSTGPREKQTKLVTDHVTLIDFSDDEEEPTKTNTLKLWLDYAANQLFYRDQWGNTPLHAAMYVKPPLDVIEALFRVGRTIWKHKLQGKIFDISRWSECSASKPIWAVPTKDGSTAFLVACSTGASTDVLQCYLDEVEYYISRQWVDSSQLNLEHSSNQSEDKMARMIVLQPDNQGNNPLMGWMAFHDGWIRRQIDQIQQQREKMMNSQYQLHQLQAKSKNNEIHQFSQVQQVHLSNQFQHVQRRPSSSSSQSEGLVDISRMARSEHFNSFVQGEHRFVRLTFKETQVPLSDYWSLACRMLDFATEGIISTDFLMTVKPTSPNSATSTVSTNSTRISFSQALTPPSPMPYSTVQAEAINIQILVQRCASIAPRCPVSLLEWILASYPSSHTSQAFIGNCFGDELFTVPPLHRAMEAIGMPPPLTAHEVPENLSFVVAKRESNRIKIVRKILHYHSQGAATPFPNGRSPLCQAIASGAHWHDLYEVRRESRQAKIKFGERFLNADHVITSNHGVIDGIEGIGDDPSHEGLVRLLWRYAPEKVLEADACTGLFPFMLAATMPPQMSPQLMDTEEKKDSGLNQLDNIDFVRDCLVADTIYNLMRKAPQLVSNALV